MVAVMSSLSEQRQQQQQQQQMQQQQRMTKRQHRPHNSPLLFFFCCSRILLLSLLLLFSSSSLSPLGRTAVGVEAFCGDTVPPQQQRQQRPPSALRTATTTTNAANAAAAVPSTGRRRNASLVRYSSSGSSRKGTRTVVASAMMQADVAERVTAVPVDAPSAVPAVDEEDAAVAGAVSPPTLSEIRRQYLPKSVFQVDTVTSLKYFALDTCAVLCSMTVLYQYVHAPIYHNLPFYLQAMTVAPLQLLAGSALWSMWCVSFVRCLFVLIWFLCLLLLLQKMILRHTYLLLCCVCFCQSNDSYKLNSLRI
jgi:hypothetical protein